MPKQERAKIVPNRAAKRKEAYENAFKHLNSVAGDTVWWHMVKVNDTRSDFVYLLIHS